MYLYIILIYVFVYHCIVCMYISLCQWLGRILTMIVSWSEKDEVQDQYKCNKAGREFAQWICRILTILKALNPTTTHSFMAALHILKALNPTTTHSFMAALHISMSLLIPSGLNSHVDIQISIELKQQNR